MNQTIKVNKDGVDVDFNSNKYSYDFYIRAISNHLNFDCKNVIDFIYKNHKSNTDKDINFDLMVDCMTFSELYKECIPFLNTLNIDFGKNTFNKINDFYYICVNQLDLKKEYVMKTIFGSVHTTKHIVIINDLFMFTNIGLKYLKEFKHDSSNEIDTSKTYIMHDGVYYKIGKSKNVESRLKTLLTGNNNIKILYTLNKNIEKFLQKEYCSDNVGGEWFNFDEYTLNELVEKYNFKKYEQQKMD